MKIFSAEKLKSLLDEMCIRHSSLAMKAGIGTSTLSSIIHGHKIPNVNTLGRISWVLGKSVDYFFEDEAIVNQCRLQFASSSPMKEVANG
jgi:predicted transcriptional regulator